MSLNYIKKLKFKVWKTNIKDQKIDGLILEIFRIVIIDYQIEDKANRSRFFQKTFLIVDTKFEIILKKLFWKISNINILFGKKIFM